MTTHTIYRDTTRGEWRCRLADGDVPIEDCPEHGEEGADGEACFYAAAHPYAALALVVRMQAAVDVLAPTRAELAAAYEAARAAAQAVLDSRCGVGFVVEIGDPV